MGGWHDVVDQRRPRLRDADRNADRIYDGQVTEPRRHHIVPKSHLRRFADGRDRVKVVDRNDPAKSFITNIGNVTVETDFYAISAGDDLSQEFEKGLATLDQDGAEAVGRMLDGAFPPVGDDRERIALFIAAQWLRGWDAREVVDVITGGLVKQRLVNTTRESIREFIRAQEHREPTSEEVERLITFARDPTKYEIDVNPREHLRQILQMLLRLTEIAHARTWQLLRASADSSFLTSDAPVALWAPEKSGTVGVGFGSADELVVALSRQHALLLVWNDPSGELVREISASLVEVVNRRTAESGRRQIIHHPDDHPLEGITLRPSRVKAAMTAPVRVVPDDK